MINVVRQHCDDPPLHQTPLPTTPRYAVPPRKEIVGKTEEYIGRWLKARNVPRDKVGAVGLLGMMVVVGVHVLCCTYALWLVVSLTNEHTHKHTPQQIIIATKVASAGFPRDFVAENRPVSNGPQQVRLSREQIHAAVEGSLRRLQTSYMYGLRCMVDNDCCVCCWSCICTWLRVVLCVRHASMHVSCGERPTPSPPPQ